MNITSGQLARLQTVYSQMARHVAGFSDSRLGRLQWASECCGRSIDSFSQLTQDEARRLIDAAQGEIGHRAPSKPRERRSVAAARRHGLDGRKDDTEFTDAPQLVQQADLENIRERYERLGWTRAAFDEWLAGRSSPLRGRKQIRTTADANKLLWALKGMLKDKGLWADWSE